MLLGLVGKPSSGKSTFFKAATLANVLIAAYPFATIKPNHGVGYVKVEDIGKEFNVVPTPKHGFILGKYRFVSIDLMDVAGLVPGASEGKGLGNQFLDDLRQADAFIHIVDASGKTDIEGKETTGYDPCKDVEFLEEELDLWYLGILNKVWKNFSKSFKTSGEGTNFAEQVTKQFSGLKIKEGYVTDAIFNSKLIVDKVAQWGQDELKKFAHELRKISKPMIIAANKCDDKDAKENINRLKEKYPNSIIIPCSADSELALREAAKSGLINYIPGESDFEIVKDLNEKQKAALKSIKENVLDVYGNTGIQNILDKSIFDLLDYIGIFPAGSKLTDSEGRIIPDCFLLSNGSTALDFAYYLHTDIGDGFIKAIDARTKKTLGKDYKLKHRDALEIVTR